MQPGPYSGALNVSSLETAISASVIQSLEAAGISALSSSYPNISSKRPLSSDGSHSTSNEVANIMGFSGETMITSSKSSNELPAFSQSGCHKL